MNDMRTATELQIQAREDDIRRRVLLMRTLDGLRRTIRAVPRTPESGADDMEIECTNASAQFIAPLVEAVQILEAIIFASDGCMGHRHCMHSMEPWQRARTLLEGKWRASMDGRHWPELPSDKP